VILNSHLGRSEKSKISPPLSAGVPSRDGCCPWATCWTRRHSTPAGRHALDDRPAALMACLSWSHTCFVCPLKTLRSSLDVSQRPRRSCTRYRHGSELESCWLSLWCILRSNQTRKQSLLWRMNLLWSGTDCHSVYEVPCLGDVWQWLLLIPGLDACTA